MAPRSTGDAAGDTPAEKRSAASTAVATEKIERTIQVGKPWWQDLLSVLATGAIAALVGGFAAIATGWFTFENRDRELDIQMVNLSFALLAGDVGGIEQTNVGTEEFGEYELSRRFALRSLKKYAGVDIPEEELVAWAKSGSITRRAIRASTAAPRVTPEELLDEILTGSTVTLRQAGKTLKGDQVVLTDAEGKVLSQTLHLSCGRVRPLAMDALLLDEEFGAQIVDWQAANCPAVTEQAPLATAE